MTSNIENLASSDTTSDWIQLFVKSSKTSTTRLQYKKALFSVKLILEMMYSSTYATFKNRYLLAPAEP